jgi:hypothetical protein
MSLHSISQHPSCCSLFWAMSDRQEQIVMNAPCNKQEQLRRDQYTTDDSDLVVAAQLVYTGYVLVSCYMTCVRVLFAVLVVKHCQYLQAFSNHCMPHIKPSLSEYNDSYEWHILTRTESSWLRFRGICQNSYATSTDRNPSFWARTALTAILQSQSMWHERFLRCSLYPGLRMIHSDVVVVYES